MITSNYFTDTVTTQKLLRTSKGREIFRIVQVVRLVPMTMGLSTEELYDAKVSRTVLKTSRIDDYSA